MAGYKDKSCERMSRMGRPFAGSLFTGEDDGILALYLEVKGRLFVWQYSWRTAEFDEIS